MLYTRIRLWGPLIDIAKDTRQRQWRSLLLYHTIDNVAVICRAHHAGKVEFLLNYAEVHGAAQVQIQLNVFNWPYKVVALSWCTDDALSIKT